MPSVEVGGVEVFYEDEGSGEPVVLLHAGGLSSLQWRVLRRFLSDYRTVAPDLLGAGKTPGPGASAPPDLSSQADIVEALAGLIGDRRFHLVGHSYGGAVAAIFAAGRGGRLCSLTLIEPTMPGLLLQRDERDVWQELVDHSRACAEEVERGETLKAAELFIRYWGGDDFWRILPPPVRQNLAGHMGTRYGGDAWTEFLDAPYDLDALGALEVPTLLLSGDKSPRPSIRLCRILEELMPRVEYQVIPGVGHMSPLTHAAKVAEPLAPHLRANPS